MLWANELTTAKSLILPNWLIGWHSIRAREASYGETLASPVAGIYTIELGKLQNWFNGEQRDLTRNYSDWTKLMAWDPSREWPTSKYRPALDSSLRLKRESTNAGHPYTHCSAKTMHPCRYCWFICCRRFNMYLTDI